MTEPFRTSGPDAGAPSSGASAESHELHDRLVELELENQALRERVESDGDRMEALLFALLELGVPGSIDRALRNAELARRLAERFDIPESFRDDLELAARFHELGKLAAPSDRVPSSRVANGWH